ncbi:DUF3857 domain-containing protein [Psychroflexus aestuariivivens]|uniref:DUF3857 domain-containing protein n=1 Tax=Psychroflexus aestuariivivens TaxID=1795040 RepID=UPI001F02D184|nr:transglutaminase domain-containing protein [Psychroflexus aestuariivivens]
MTKSKPALNLKKMTSKILFLICLVSTCIGFSQPQELEDITVEMLKSTQSEIDSTASAEVLYEKGKISFILDDLGWRYVFEMHRRIKIFNKDGYDQANIEIPYYVGESNSAKENIKRIKAYTYYLENDKIEDEKVRNKDIYDLELSELVEAKKFTFPKIQDGVIIDYSFIIESPHIRNLPKWSFQSKIPTRYSEYATVIPTEYLNYRSQSRGFYRIETTTEELDISLQTMNGGVQTKSIRTRNYTRNLPGIEPENHVNNISNYTTAVSYELSSYRSGGQYDIEYLSSSWKDVIKNLKESETFSKELQRTNYFEEDLANVLEGASSQMDKINRILNFVKSKMKWNEENRRFCSDKLKRVYDDGVGNSADINIMLTAMLRHANLNANPVVSSTISNGIPFFPTVSGFNYVLSGVTVDGQYYLLDATDNFSSLNLLPTRTMNWQGIELTPDSSRDIRLVPEKASKVNFNVFAKINKDGMLSGQCRVYYFDQFALNARNAFSKTSEEKVKEAYEKQYKVNNVHDFSQDNLESLNKPLVQTFKFGETEGFVEKIGEKLYISPLVFLKSENNPFKAKERNYPIDYTFPKSYKFRLNIDLPEGYEVDYVPEKNIFNFSDEMLSFTYIINAANGKLVIDVTKDINVAIIPTQYYTNLREYYISMLDKENEKVVLVKQ